MPTQTTISVALASYNGGRFIDEQLDSLASQSRLPDELIVSDDASTDDTCAKIASFSARAPFDVKLIPATDRVATTANFGRALAECQGNIIFFADQDDYWRPNKIERMVDHFDSHPETGGLFCNAAVVDETRVPRGYDIWQAQGFNAAEQTMVHSGDAALVFLKHVVAAGNTFAFRGRFKSLVLPIPDLRSVHDAWVAFLIAAVSDFDILDEELVEYRLHDDNQFGLGLLDLRAQFEKARLQVNQRAFSHALRLFGAALSRLDDHPEFPVSPDLRQHILAKIEHSQVRDGLSSNPFTRLPAIIREGLRGHYGKYGYGYKSVAQDLFLR